MLLLKFSQKSAKPLFDGSWRGFPSCILSFLSHNPVKRRESGKKMTETLPF